MKPSEIIRLVDEDFRIEDKMQLFVDCPDATRLVLHAFNCIEKAIHDQSNLHEELAKPAAMGPLIGFSGSKFRRLMNNLGALVEGVNYLEVGVYKGSTFVSTLWGNFQTINKAYAIDNWSWPKNTSENEYEFAHNCNQCLPDFVKSDKFVTIKGDCFDIDLSTFKEKINLYFYDAGHTKEDQKRAYTYYDSILADTFITLVDDWESNKVRVGTLEAFEELGYNILAAWQIFPPLRENPTEHPSLDWWHGMIMCVVQKTKQNDTQNPTQD